MASLARRHIAWYAAAAAAVLMYAALIHQGLAQWQERKLSHRCAEMSLQPPSSQLSSSAVVYPALYLACKESDV